MKQGIHPDYREVVFMDMSNGFKFVTKSTIATREKIKMAAAGVLERLHEFEPFTLEPPIEVELTFNHSGLADAAAIMPGTKRVDATTVGYTSDDYMEVFRAFLTMTRLAQD